MSPPNGRRALKPTSFAPVRSQNSVATPFVYHGTTASLLLGIQRYGLLPNADRPMHHRGVYQRHSRNRVFFTLTWGAAMPFADAARLSRGDAMSYALRFPASVPASLVDIDVAGARWPREVDDGLACWVPIEAFTPPIERARAART